MFGTQGEEAFDGQYQLVRHFLEELSISFGILTHLRTENDHYAQALTSRDQGHGAVRSKPLFDVVLLDLEFKLLENFSQVGLGDGGSVDFEYRSVTLCRS